MSAPHLAPGTVLSGRSYNFSIQALVGHSGSAATFRVLSSAGGEAMVKVYDPAVRQRPDITGAMERVYAETMQLPGDVIVHVLEAGYDPTTGAPFSATAFVQLPSLAQLVARRPLSLAEVTGMLKSVARGLDAAHIRQVSHHALKPTNVFLGGAPNYEARITDFGAGLVRIAVPTHDGYALSAPWLAPEQVQQGQQAGPAADIFSIALVAFFALTGRSFWRACQGQTPDLNAWQQELFGGRAVASLRASEIGIPLNAALDPIFSRALAVDPRQRYRTVGELAAAVDSAANSQQAVGATMAFPAIPNEPSQPGAQGGYGPPPQPMVAPTQISPQQQPNPALQQSGPQGQWGGAAAPQGGPAQARPPQPSSPDLGNASALATMVPQALERPRARASKAVPIFLGITAAVLIGGAAAAFVFLGKKDTTAPATTSTAVAVPTSSAAPTPSETASAAPTTSATATASATAEAAPPEVEVKVVCVPGCDSVQIDGKAVEEITKPAKLAAGKHTLTAAKEGYTTLEESVEVEITGTTGKVTFTKEGSPAVSVPVKDISKPIDHKAALALQPVAKSTSTPATTGASTATSTKPTGTGASTGTGGGKKPPCKNKFGVGCN
jgi:serine/threonine protein kinase